MGAGASVAHELSLPAIHNNLHHVGKSVGGTKPRGGQYGDMLVHLRLRFQEEMEILRTEHGEIDQNLLLVRLLQEEIAFSTVEVGDLAALKLRRRAEGKVYVLGESHFLPPPVSDGGLVVASLTPKALEMTGDESLSVVARESLPTNVKTKKKAVELMGSVKVVTEKKALKRLGSEMTENMRTLQLKTERREQKKAEDHHR